MVIKKDIPSVGLVEAAYAVEEGGLAGAIRANKPYNLAWSYLK
jgi:hypothetical protein